MKQSIGIGEMKLSSEPGDILVTHALGSCLGVAIHDDLSGIGGILHYMLPRSTDNTSTRSANPCMFGDTGILHLFQEAFRLGADRNRLSVIIAGGARVLDVCDTYDIGRRNITVARKFFWKNGILIKAEHVGDSIPRTLYLEIGTGRSWFTSRGTRTDLT